MTDRSINFFISYTHADKDWAEWIAWTLEERGYTTVLQAWDFRPGSNFVLEMQQAAAQTERLIAVLSGDYLKSAFAAPEWAATFAQDPKGIARKLVPVMVRKCEPDGLLSQVVQIRIFDLDKDAAKRELLAGLEVSRSKPATAPAFPGAQVKVSDKTTSLPGPLPWRPLSVPTDVRWRSSFRPVNSNACLELHIAAIGGRIEARALTQARERLIDLGRRQGLFKMEAGIDVTNEHNALILQANQDDRGWDTAGLIVARSGQVGCWYTLPHDSLGSVFDESDTRARIHMLLQVITATGLLTGTAVAIGIGIAPVGLLQLGDVSQIGKRSSATMSMASREGILLTPEDELPIEALDRYEDIADELVAQLVGAIRRTT